MPFIFNVADLWPDTLKQMKVINNGFILKAAYVLERATYRWARYINCVTEGNIKTLVESKGVPEDKILFLPNGVDVEMFRPMEPDKELASILGVSGKKVIIFAGGLGYAQGLDVVINAMSLLKNRLQDLVFILLGSGPERGRLINLAKRLALNNVIFVDAKPMHLVPNYYSISYAGFASLKNLPLFEEVRPSKIFPAMACGKPVIYSGAGEMTQLIEQSESGLVVPPEDPQRLAEAIVKLVQDEKLAQQMGINGRRYVEEHHDWKIIINNWLMQLGEKRVRLS